MYDLVHKHKRIAQFILALIMVPFAFFGVDYYFRGSGGVGEVAKFDGGKITEAGLRTNISVAIQYIDNWLRGIGAAAINNLMEDAATAEISRAQIWQWIRHNLRTDGGEPITIERYRAFRDEEVAKLDSPRGNRYADAVEILNTLIESDDFIPFLTLPAYEYLDGVRA